MTDKSEVQQSADHDKRQPRRVRVPGFVSDEDIGLGDAIKRTTAYFGIMPCGGCDKRAARLNRWMVLTR